MKKLTVIIPVYNEEATLEEIVRRVQEAPFPLEKEILIVNDASTDGTREILARLVAWAENRGTADGQWLGYMWDDPEIVALADCRYDVGVEVDGVRPDGEIGRIEFPAMRVAQVEVRGDIDLEQRCCDWLYKAWLPSSGFVPDEQPAFEAWMGRPYAHGLEYFELYAELPVVRA